MLKRDIERNIRLFIWFRILREPLLWGPILILFIVNIGKMPLSEVYIMESLVVVAAIFSEIYSSSWADLLGRKKTMIIGIFLSLIAVVIFAIIDSPLEVWIANILIMIGFSIVSGADEAFLADTLKSAGREGELIKIYGLSNSYRYLLVAIGSIFAGYLYEINPRLPIVLSIPPLVVSFVLLFFLKEPKRFQKASHKEHFNLMKISILFMVNHKKIKWIIVYLALIIVSSKLWFFSYNPYFELVEIEPRFFGWIFFGLNLVAWLFSKYAYKIVKIFSEKQILIGMIFVMSAPMFVMGTFVSKSAALLVFVENISRGFREPFFLNMINSHLDSENRATTLSIKSAVIQILSAISLFAYGLVLSQYALPKSLQILSLTVLVFGLYLIFRYETVFKNK